MKFLGAILPVILLGACATQVYHPTKSTEEMKADIKSCTDTANRKYWLDAFAALDHAYECLDELGYRRGQAEMETKVQNAVNEDRVKNDKPILPCRVPCKKQR